MGWSALLMQAGVVACVVSRRDLATKLISPRQRAPGSPYCSQTSFLFGPVSKSHCVLMVDESSPPRT